jgi:hypothetical protein
MVQGSKGVPMAFKPNYRQQRVERDRAKKARQQKKLEEQQERTAKRKASDPSTSTESEQH